MITLVIAPMHLKARGHAGYDVPGRDIVCAAVSTLFSALALGLEREQNYGCLARLEIELGEGVAEIRATPHPLYVREVQLLFDVFAQALVQIAEQYPEYIKVAP